MPSPREQEGAAVCHCRENRRFISAHKYTWTGGGVFRSSGLVSLRSRKNRTFDLLSRYAMEREGSGGQHSLGASALDLGEQRHEALVANVVSSAVSVRKPRLMRPALAAHNLYMGERRNVETQSLSAVCTCCVKISSQLSLLCGWFFGA